MDGAMVQVFDNRYRKSANSQTHTQPCHDPKSFSYKTHKSIAVCVLLSVIMLVFLEGGCISQWCVCDKLMLFLATFST